MSEKCIDGVKIILSISEIAECYISFRNAES